MQQIVRGLLLILSAISLMNTGWCEVKPDTAGYWQVGNTEELLKAASEMGPSGGTIVLKSGVYIINETISFNKTYSCCIKGSGWNTTIQKIGAGDAFSFTDCSFAFIEDMLINGDASAKTGSGIVFKGISGSNTIDTCRISNFAQSGVRFEGDPKSAQSTNSVKNCHFIDNHEDQLWSCNNNDFYITGNQFGVYKRLNDLAPRTGAVLDHSSAGTYSMNYHWENRVAMRLGPGAQFNRIENNRFENSREQGVIIGSPDGGDGCYLNIILGNTFHTNSMGKSGGFAAVEAYNAAQITFTSNQVFSWDSQNYKHKSSLIIGKGCSKWIVKDNIFLHNTEKPLVYEKTASHIIRDNMTK